MSVAWSREGGGVVWWDSVVWDSRRIKQRKPQLYLWCHRGWSWRQKVTLSHTQVHLRMYTHSTVVQLYWAFLNASLITVWLTAVYVWGVAGQRVSCILGSWVGGGGVGGGGGGGVAGLACWVQSWGPKMGIFCVYICVCVWVNGGMPLFAEWRARRQESLSKYTSVC